MKTQRDAALCTVWLGGTTLSTLTKGLEDCFCLWSGVIPCLLGPCSRKTELQVLLFLPTSTKEAHIPLHQRGKRQPAVLQHMAGTRFSKKVSFHSETN